MPETIEFDRKLAEEMQRNLSDLMYRTCTGLSLSGRTIYECTFCSAYCYGPGPLDTRINEIDHYDWCLGEKVMKELDGKL